MPYSLKLNISCPTVVQNMYQFTNAIRQSVKDANWFAGLFLALCMPDICSALETPALKVGVRYQRWFSDNLGEQYAPMFSAADCYFFRCSCLHQGLDTDDRLSYERIHFIIPPPRNSTVHRNLINNVLQMQIDVFCNDIAEAVDCWYETRAKNCPDIRARIEGIIKINDMDSLQPFISFD